MDSRRSLPSTPIGDGAEHRAYTLWLTAYGQETLERLRPIVADFNSEVAEAIAPATVPSVTKTLIRLADMNPDASTPP